jgi:hypothetical protein
MALREFTIWQACVPSQSAERSAQELLDRMPASAVADMMEWGPEKTPLRQLQYIVSRPASLPQLISLSASAPTLDDDRPINEYNQLRTLFPGHMASFDAQHMGSVIR